MIWKLRVGRRQGTRAKFLRHSPNELTCGCLHQPAPPRTGLCRVGPRSLVDSSPASPRCAPRGIAYESSQRPAILFAPAKQHASTDVMPARNAVDRLAVGKCLSHQGSLLVLAPAPSCLTQNNLHMASAATSRHELERTALLWATERRGVNGFVGSGQYVVGTRQQATPYSGGQVASGWRCTKSRR
jgi:hypothetical protein